jgi:N utilization substance protein B
VTPNELHEARRLSLQLLCALDVQGADAWPALERFLSDTGRDAQPSARPPPEAVLKRARELTRMTFEKRAVWDEQIAGVSQRWDVKRMGLVDRNVLRLALHEMSQPEITPVKVAMNEAIELAREFGAEESPAFVNGVLDAIWRRVGATEGRSDEASAR